MLDTKQEDYQDDIELTGEENFDEPELEDLEKTSKDKIKILRDSLKSCEAEKAEHLEALQRAKAEFLNTRKRLEDERIRDKERAIETQILKLLPLCDSFEMAMSNKETWSLIDENWRNGVEGIYNQLKGILDSYGVTQLKPIDEVFDPNHHEAVGTVDSDKETDTVVAVLQSGYMRNNELIRAAKVTLSN